ncbi:ERCC1 isoform 5, partial [Pan troglodytes]
NLHPDYIHGRLQSLGKNFALRVLLVQVDVKDPQQALKELAKMCILADCTLILAWSLWNSSSPHQEKIWPYAQAWALRRPGGCLMSCTSPS